MTTKPIMDGNAESNETAPVAKKRTRIVKKDTEHVYSATKNQGERFDTVEDERAHKRAAVAMAKDEKAAAIHALESEVLVAPRKNRGRPSKAYLEAQRAYEEALARRQNELDEAKAALSGGIIPSEAIEEPEMQSGEETAPAEVSQNQSHIDEDDIPDFIRMQQAATSLETTDAPAEVPTDTPADAPAEASVDAPAEASADAPAETSPDASTEAPAEAPVATSETLDETVPTEGNETAPEVADEAPRADEEANAGAPETSGKTLAQAYAEGERFIIIQDVPVIEDEGFFADNYTDDMQQGNPSYYNKEDDFYAREESEHIGFRRFKDDVAVSATNAIDNARAIAALRSPNEQRETAAPAAVSAAKPVAERRPETVRIDEIIIDGEGVLELDHQGVGYLRSADYNYMPSPDDVFVSQNQIRAYGLKTGDMVTARIRTPKEGEKFYALKEVISINGRAPHEVRDRIAFEHLTPLFPDEQFRLSKRGTKAPLSCRIVDLFAPIGKGQRALIVAQPKTGKTILMKQIANAIAANYPDTYLMMLLIDERPEEVTDMSRTVNAEVIASTFDEPAKRHVRIANIVLEKAKRMVECGHDVVIFLDSITRLARAFNTEAPTSGKILTGGVDANALQKPKRFFGAARNIEGGGSLTIIATALTDTGSKMDEVIFEEFKGTGNMELQLDRNLANKRIYPAVNLVQSSTRREDLLLDEITINRMFITRNFMSDMSPIEAMNFIKKHLESTISNEEFIATVGS